MENVSLRGDWQGKMIGRYQLERVLGRGAASEVWLATDTQLRRQVAIKVLPPAVNDQVYLRDFVYEARAAAALEHPHILGIHDFGEQEVESGEIIPYLVLPYVADGTLAERMKEASGPLVIQESLRYLRQAALAIDYAHSRRVLHRDIKPGNMLLRDDWLLLTDFGLAKVLGATMLRGQTYAGSGTPEYMAPEQIMGQALPASDRYSLAVVAYQLFTGRTPYQGATPVETMDLQMRQPLPPPRSLNPRIPVQVENLLMIALSRNPELRPPSCLELVNALQRAWMTGKQTEPNPEATLLAPWSKRLQDQSAGANLSSGSSAELFSSSHPALSPVPTPATGILPADDSIDQAAARSKTLTDPNPTSGPPTPPDPFATRTGVDTVPSRSGSSAGTSYQPGTLERKMGRRSIVIGGAVAAAAVIGGGVAAFEIGRARLAGNSQSVKPTPTPAGPFNLVAGTPVLQLTGHTANVWTASWHPGGRYLLTAGADGYLMIWDIGTALQNSIPGSLLANPIQKLTVAGIKFEDLTDTVCWSLDGKRLVVGNTFNSKAYVLNAFGAAGAPAVYTDQALNIMGYDVIYNNVIAGPAVDQFSILNTAINSTQLQVWRFGQTNLPVVNYEVGDEIGEFAWSPDNSMLVGLSGVLGTRNGFYLWNKEQPLKTRFIARPQRDKFLSFAVIADTIAWSPTTPYQLLVSDADEALIYDVRKNQPLLTLGATVDSSIPVISKMSWSPNGRYVAASYDPVGDNTRIPVKPQIFIWDIPHLLKLPAATKPRQPTLSFSAPVGAIGHTMGITDLRWSPDGRYIATASFDKTVVIWKVDR